MIDSAKTAHVPISATTESGWYRVAALALAVVAVRLPINHLLAYAVVLIAAVLIFSGSIALRLRNWTLAIAAVAIAVALSSLLAPAPIAEGENVFLPVKQGNVFERELPADVYRSMKTEFDALYPPDHRCTPDTPGCWLNRGSPSRLYAFSADGALDHPAYSRSVTSIDFSDPVWFRLGFINDIAYNWYTDAPDVHRADPDRRFWMGLRRWHLAMPWFVMYQFPAAYAGSSLCWRGEVLWPRSDSAYETIRHAETACRVLQSEDIGRQIFGVALHPDLLAMTLYPPWPVKARRIACAAVALLAVLAVLGLLWRGMVRQTVRPFVLIGLALIVIAVNDASLIGGWRPLDRGDDGLLYTGLGRDILQHFLRGDLSAALAGGERVYYYGGPGLRYLRTIEMIFFGDSNLGYLSLILLMPIIVLSLFKRFLSDAFAWRLALIFTIVPIGAIFGSSFFDYAKWAARGFADPAAQILLLAGLLVIVKPSDGAIRAYTAGGAAFLLALAVFVKPIIAPIAGIVLGGAGVAALAQRRWRSLLAMCAGFLPVLVMPLHNWYFGHAFVLLSSNARLPGTYLMPPAAYLSAFGELLRLDFGGAKLHAAVAQIGAWLSEPSRLLVSIPFNLAAVVIVLYVTLRGRDFDPWLRLIGTAVLAEYVVDLIYAATPRYFYVMWLLTFILVAVFAERRLPAWTQEHGWQRTGRAFARLRGYESGTEYD